MMGAGFRILKKQAHIPVLFLFINCQPLRHCTSHIKKLYKCTCMQGKLVLWTLTQVVWGWQVNSIVKHKIQNLPIQLCRNLLIADKSARVMRSPKLAAMGVATLSGLMLHFLEQSTTATITEPRIRLANVAVTKLLAQRRLAWWMLNSPSSIHPMITAANAANAPTIVAWTCRERPVPACL